MQPKDLTKEGGKWVKPKSEAIGYSRLLKRPNDQKDLKRAEIESSQKRGQSSKAKPPINPTT